MSAENGKKEDSQAGGEETQVSSSPAEPASQDEAGGRAETVTGEGPPNADPAVLLTRIARMQTHLLQDRSADRQALTQLQELLEGELRMMHSVLAIVSRGVAENRVSAREDAQEARRLFSERFDSVQGLLASELQDLAAERILHMALAETIDDVEAVLREAPAGEAGAAAFDALRMVRNRLLGGLSRMGIAQLDIQPGITVFNETLHECVGVEQDFGQIQREAQMEVVTAVVRQGYTIGSKVTRRANVIVERR